MNALFLVGTAAIAFVFGYRFFAKLLALGVLRLGANYSTETAAASGHTEVHGTGRHLLLIHHAIILTSGATVIGSVIALTWGWIPALLWIVIGTTVGGGMLNMGSLWLATRYPRPSLLEFGAALGGRLLGVTVVSVAALMLVLLAALCTVITAKLLVMQPQVVPTLIIVVMLSWLLGRVLRHRVGLDILPITIIALIVVLALMWLTTGYPVSLSGALNFDIAGSSWFSINALVGWVLALAVFGFVASQLTPGRFAQPYALLNTLLLAALLIVMLAGLLIAPPRLIAPEFHSPTDGPGYVPWLFVLLCSGAVAGLAFVAAATTTAPRLPKPADARYVGYGSAIIEGVVALAALIIAGVAFTDVEVWKQHLGQWPAILDLGTAVAVFLDGLVRLSGTLEIEAVFARTLAATIVAGLCLTTLEASLRMLTALFADFTGPLALSAPKDQLLRRLTASGVVLAIVLGTVAGSGGKLLLAYGATSLGLAALAFAFLSVGLRAHGRSVFLAAACAVFLVAILLWFVVERMAAWWHADRWVPFLAGIVLFGVFGAVALALARAYRHPPSSPT